MCNKTRTRYFEDKQPAKNKAYCNAIFKAYMAYMKLIRNTENVRDFVSRVQEPLNRRNMHKEFTSVRVCENNLYAVFILGPVWSLVIVTKILIFLPIC